MLSGALTTSGCGRFNDVPPGVAPSAQGPGETRCSRHAHPHRCHTARTRGNEDPSCDGSRHAVGGPLRRQDRDDRPLRRHSDRAVPARLARRIPIRSLMAIGSECRATKCSLPGPRRDPRGRIGPQQVELQRLCHGRRGHEVARHVDRFPCRSATKEIRLATSAGYPDQAQVMPLAVPIPAIAPGCRRVRHVALAYRGVSSFSWRARTLAATARVAPSAGPAAS